MKKALRYIILAGLALFTTASVFNYFKLQEALKERDRLGNNQIVLLGEIDRYKAADSLNAVRVHDLRLTLDEYKRYHADDLELIRKLKLAKSDMQKVIDANLVTIGHLRAQARDTIIYRTDTPLPPIKAKTFNFRSKWLDADGILDMGSGAVDLDYQSRESLVLVETVKYRRFLGFLWKTKRVKSRQIDIVSRNPKTDIIGVEYVSVEKQ